MQPEIDAQLTNFFEDAPARDFAKVMRGYDQHQVDEYLKQSDLEMRQHREQVQALQQELTEAHRQIREQERPTYSGLGSRIEQLLRLAEEQATEPLGLPGRLARRRAHDHEVGRMPRSVGWVDGCMAASSHGH